MEKILTDVFSFIRLASKFAFQSNQTFPEVADFTDFSLLTQNSGKINVFNPKVAHICSSCFLVYCFKKVKFKTLKFKQYLKSRLGPAWFAIHLDSLLIRNKLMIRKWVNHDSPTFDFLFDLIRRWIMIRAWIVIRDV